MCRLWAETFYLTEHGWSVGHNGWPFIMGDFAYCVRILAELEALP